MPMAIASPLSVNHGDMLQFMNLLNLSSRKLRQVEREKTIYSEEIVQLGESNRRKEYKIQALQMINKFQKAHIDQLRSDKGLDVLVDGERAMLKLEVMELEKCMQNNPQVTRFALENLQLRQQLERYQDIENRYLEGEWWDPYEEDSLVLSERIAMLVSDWASANATTFESPESLKQRAYQPTPAPSECISPSDIGNWLNDQSDSEFLRYRMEELQTDLDINVKTLHSQSERLTAYTTSHQQLDQVYSKLCTTLDRPMQVLCLDPKDYDPEDRLPELESAVMHSRKAAYELILEHPALSSASYGPVHSTNGCNGNGNMGGMSASESARMSSTADMGCIRLASTLMSYLRSSLSICEWMIDHYHHGSGGSRTDGEKRSNAVTIQHLENTIQTLTTQLEQTRYELKLSGEGASDHRAALWDALQLLPNIPNDDFRSMEPAVVRRRIEALVDQFQAGRQRIQALETEIAFHRQQANRPTTNGQHLSAELPPLPSPSTTRRNGLRNMDSAKSLDDLIRPRNPSYSRSSVHRVDTI
ncbi:hypothetical protein H4R33_006976 [Dimargaris cristalligena]|nr:hypothetical protein H4R33_006976 [Dimargaris cristalligena]